jgi:hypothetical protein
MSQSMPYTQTILLDANRLSSEEFSASNLANSNPAVFTNKVASGITLDIGDQVSIQSAHIAQRGAGGQVIEMKGKNLGKKTINYTKFTNSSFIGTFLDEGISVLYSRYTSTGFAKQDVENVDEEVDMKDNEATIVVEFYKTANGENCMTLPRNFGNVSGNNASVAGYNKPGGAGLGTAAEYWQTDDGYPLGHIAITTFDLNRRLILNSSLREDDDWGKYYPIRGFDGTEFGDGTKIRQDNSRFTLFKRKSIVYNGSEVSAEDLASSLQPRAGVKPDPAIAEYVRFKKKLTLRVNEGYNTPSNIAAQITDQLTEPEDSKTIIAARGDFKAVIQESKLNLCVGSPNYRSFNSSGNKDFFNANLSNHMPVSVGASSLQTKRAVAYSNAYDYVGFKRPEFVESGRNAFAYHGNKITSDITNAEKSTAVIITNMTWTDEILLKIKKFFDSQKLYPQLLDGGVDDLYPRTNYATFNTTSASLSASFREVGRFLHMDLGFQSQGTKKTAIEPLGDDMYNVSHSILQISNASDRTSCPVFVYYDDNTSHLTASDTNGDTDYNLAYGFARNVNGFIAFTTRLIGGIPDIWMDLGGTGNIANETKIGYDYHFSGYGNAAIALHSGYNPLQYFGHQEFINSAYIENMYLGADNPLFNFDTTENRFEFSNLHTAEKTGNFYNAGDPQAPGNILAPPPSGTAQDPIYFINKQMRYDSWTPDLHPYPTINLSGTTASGNIQSFIEMPIRLEEGVPYDAHSGISIVDMGVTEDKWDQSLWGLLGFRYGQFNASGSNIQNENYKFNNLPSNVTSITTNALLTSLQSQQYFQNCFSIPLMKPMVSSNLNYFDSAKTHANLTSASGETYVTPAITIQQESTVVKAHDLPRKVLRGYFLINSDILDQANYYQLSNPLQTMAICGKYNSADDFVNYEGGGPVFTVTRKKTITDIKTQILDPEGELSQVGDNSGVIYKITKEIKTDLKFGENLLAGMYGKPPQ